MTLVDEDELAIHTVLAAAYDILRDLKKQRGRRELADRLAVGVFAVASDLVSGKIARLPSIFAKSDVLANHSRGFCRDQPRGSKERKMSAKS
jgi:hypothetical protein